jgi:uncharacterized protein YhaN
MEVLNTKIKQLEDDIASEESILESKSEKLSDIIHEIPDYSYSNFKLEFMQLKKYRVTIREKNEALNNLLANSSKEEVEDLLRMNASELLKLDVEWNKLKLDYVSFSDDEINEIVHIDALSEEVREIERHYTETLGRVKESSNSGVNDLVLEEELESLLDEKEKLEYKACVLEILMKYLDETDKDIKTRFAPQVAEKMTPWLSRITSNRYSTISLNADLELSVNVPDIDSFVDIGALSRGTQDQIYLGLRIVIGDLISGERNVPIFLDDTMHTFDSVRLTSVKTMFDEISHERQIFLFSHNDAYKDWGEQGAIIEL